MQHHNEKSLCLRINILGTRLCQIFVHLHGKFQFFRKKRVVYECTLSQRLIKDETYSKKFITTTAITLLSIQIFAKPYQSFNCRLTGLVVIDIKHIHYERDLVRMIKLGYRIFVGL